MSPNLDSGSMLTVDDIDTRAIRIDNMWRDYNTARLTALKCNEEVRQYVYSTEVATTSADNQDHKNKTHQPKLTQIADTLKSLYWQTAFGRPDNFLFSGQTPEDKVLGKNITALLRHKLEQKKFRTTVGRQLVSDYVDYGNFFPQVDYVVEKNHKGDVTYKGPVISRVSPLDIVFNPHSESFYKSPKIQRKFIHIGKLAELPSRYPTAGFDEGAINKAVQSRRLDTVDDWVELIKDRNITIDGYGSMADYFKQDMVDLLIYRGDVFNPDTGETQVNRVVYVIDRLHVIRNEPAPSTMGYTGIHQGGWRIRSDNLWAQGPLDNLVGMQYRIDHLENLKADVFDLIAYPCLKIIGDDVIEPEEGFAPGAVYYMGEESNVQFLAPDTTALNANTEIQVYHRMLDDFVGIPAMERGIRTPGEKTAFEVDTLETNAQQFFRDKTLQFEQVMEEVYKECYELILANFDETEYVEVFNDALGQDELRELQLADVQAKGDFLAIGTRHWEEQRKRTRELLQFQQGPMQDPKIRNHVSGFKLAKVWEELLGIEDDELIEENIGVKEDVRTARVAEEENNRLAEETGSQGPQGQVPPGNPQPV